MAKEDSAVKATTTTITGLTMPADTAACPMIRPPTMPMVLPIGPGMRIPASRRSSKANSMIKTSTTLGKGTLALPPAKEKSRFAGRMSGW